MPRIQRQSSHIGIHSVLDYIGSVLIDLKRIIRYCFTWYGNTFVFTVQLKQLTLNQDFRSLNQAFQDFRYNFWKLFNYNYARLILAKRKFETTAIESKPLKTFPFFEYRRLKKVGTVLKIFFKL